MDDRKAGPRRRRTIILILAVAPLIIVWSMVGNNKARSAISATSGWVEVACPTKDTNKHQLYWRCNLVRPEAVRIVGRAATASAITVDLKCGSYTLPPAVDLYVPPPRFSFNISKATHKYLYAVMHASSRCTMKLIMVTVTRKAWGIHLAVYERRRSA